MNEQQMREQLQAEVLAHTATAAERDRLRAVAVAAQMLLTAYENQDVTDEPDILRAKLVAVVAPYEGNAAVGEESDE